MHELAAHGLDPTVTASLVGASGLIVVAVIGALTGSRPHRLTPAERHAALTDDQYHKQLQAAIAGCEHDAAIVENDLRDLRTQFEGLVTRRRAFELFLAFRGYNPDKIMTGRESDAEVSVHAPL